MILNISKDDMESSIANAKFFINQPNVEFMINTFDGMGSSPDPNEPKLVPVKTYSIFVTISCDSKIDKSDIISVFVGGEDRTSFARIGTNIIVTDDNRIIIFINMDSNLKDVSIEYHTLLDKRELKLNTIL